MISRTHIPVGRNHENCVKKAITCYRLEPFWNFGLVKIGVLDLSYWGSVRMQLFEQHRRFPYTIFQDFRRGGILVVHKETDDGMLKLESLIANYWKMNPCLNSSIKFENSS